MKRASTGAAVPPPPAFEPNRQPQCRTCDGTTWVYDDDNAVRRCPDCWERKRGSAPGVPKDLSGLTLDSYNVGDLTKTAANTDPIRQCRYFVEAVHSSLYLFGSVGTGKTALAAATLNTLYRAGKTCRFWRVTDLLSGLIGDGATTVLGAVRSIPVVVIDDLGAQKPNDWQRQTLLQVHDARHDLGHQTIWTSNLNLEDLVQFMGDDERLASRIAGAAKVIELDGPDYRLKAAKRRQRKPDRIT